MFCPNYKNKEVFDGFNEIVKALGGKPLTEEEFRSSELRNQRTGRDYSAMEATYKAYHRNGGHMLDKAPNGEHSVLFDSLLDYFKGDKAKAIVAKSNVYSDEFANWFGDWWGPLNVQDKDIKYGPISKVVDENGEPLVMWHGSMETEQFLEFKPEKIKTGGGFWFTSKRKDAYYSGIKIPAYLNIKTPYNRLSEFIQKYGENSLDDIRNYYNKESQLQEKPNYPEEAFREANLIFYGNDQFLSGTDLDPAMYRSRKWRLDKLKLGFDGEISDGYFVVVNSNQIKHIENPNLWSNNDNRIMFNVVSKKTSRTDNIRKLKDYYRTQDYMLEYGNKYYQVAKGIAKTISDKIFSDSYYADSEDAKMDAANKWMQEAKSKYGNLLNSIKIINIGNHGSVKVYATPKTASLFIDEYIDGWLKGASDETIRLELLQISREDAGDFLYYINPRKRLAIREQILRKNQYIEELIDHILGLLDAYPNDRDSNLYVDLYIQWLKNDIADHMVGLAYKLLFPIFKEARKRGYDILKFKTPIDLILWYINVNVPNVTWRQDSIDISKFDKFSLNRIETLDGKDVYIYDIENTKDGLQLVVLLLAETSPIINGKTFEFSPWCLSRYHYNEDADVAVPTSRSVDMWEHYNGGKRLIAICEGHPIAFNSSVYNNDLWWDFLDEPHDSISQVNLALRESRYTREINTEANADIPSSVHMGPYIAYIDEAGDVITIQYDRGDLSITSRKDELSLIDYFDSIHPNYLGSVFVEDTNDGYKLRFNSYTDTAALSKHWPSFLSTYLSEVANKGTSNNNIIPFKTVNSLNEHVIDSVLRIDLDSIPEIKLAGELIHSIFLSFTNNQRRIILSSTVPFNKAFVQDTARTFLEINKIASDAGGYLREYMHRTHPEIIRTREYNEQERVKHTARILLALAASKHEYQQYDEVLEEALVLQEDDYFWRKYKQLEQIAEKEELSNKLKQILEKYHFVIREQDLSEIFGEDVKGSIDFLLKIVYLTNNGDRNAITFSEEFAHAFIKLMSAGKYRSLENREDFPENALFSDLIDLIAETPFYKNIREQYKNISIYQYPDGTPNETLIREEVLGKALAIVLNTRFDRMLDEKSRSVFSKVLAWFNGIIKSIKRLFVKDKRTLGKLERELNKLADSILDGTYEKKYLNKIDDSNYRQIGYQESLNNADPMIIDLLRDMTNSGGIITGSLSYRAQTPFKRPAIDNLHDIDIAFPISAHGLHLSYPQDPRRFPSMYFIGGRNRENYWNLDRIMQAISANARTNSIMMQLRQRPNFEVVFAFPANGNIIVSGVFSENKDLVDRFLALDGAYKNRLKHFTEDEVQQLVIVDLFFNGTDDAAKNKLQDEVNQLTLTNYTVSFREKLRFGRAKDIYDYLQLDPGNNRRFRGAGDNDDVRGSIMYNLSSQALQRAPIIESVLDIHTQVEDKRNIYVQDVIDQYKESNKDLSEEQLNHNIARIRSASKVEFDRAQLKTILKSSQATIANSLGMFYYQNAGYFVVQGEYSETEKTLFEYVVNSLDQDTFARYKLNNNLGFNIAHPTEDAALNVIHQAIYNGDLQTLDKSLATSYVRIFWKSDLIQAGLLIVKDGQEMSSKQAEKLLVDAITTEDYTTRYSNNRLIDYISRFWDALKNLAAKIFNNENLTEDEKLQIMEGITSAYAYSNDIEIEEGVQPIMDRADGNFQTSRLVSEKDRKLLENIKEGTKVRLKSQISRNVKNISLINGLKLQLAKLDAKDENDIDDIFDAVESFLIGADQEIIEAKKAIDQMLNEDPLSWNADVINRIRQDLIGYYKGILSDIDSIFTTVDPKLKKKSALAQINDQRKQDPQYIDVEAYARQLWNDIMNLERYYTQEVARPYSKAILNAFVNSEEGDFIEDKEQFLKTLQAFFDQNMVYGDLGLAELVVGMASRSLSPVVRIVERMMSKTELHRDRKVLRKGQELIRKYNQIRPIGSQLSPINFQKIFMELDSVDGMSGLPTGYLIRDINFGKFYKDKDEYEELLRREFADKGVTAKTDDITGLVETVFPEEDTLADNSVYNQYMDKLDKWLCQHANRRYTYEYYHNKRRYLSREAIQAQYLILRQIDLLRARSLNEIGVEDVLRLTKTERQYLSKLIKQKQELASAYRFRLIGGILQLEEKTGEEAAIALQIRNWNKHVLDKVKYKSNEARYNADLLKMIDKYGQDSEEVKRFVKENTHWRISSEFWEYLFAESQMTPQTAEYEALKERHKEIMNRLRTGNNYNGYELELAGTGLRMDNSLWRELAKIEQLMADAYTPSEQDTRSNDRLLQKVLIKTKANLTEPYLKHIQEVWQADILTDNAARDVFNQLFTYVNHEGKRKFLRAFSYLSPTVAYLDNNGLRLNTIERYFSSTYSDLDEESEYVNSNFDFNSQESIQPICREKGTARSKDSSVVDYTNDRFLEIQKNQGYMEFYNMLLDTLNEANDMIPTRALSRSYLLPQITGRGLSILARSSVGGRLFNSIGYGIKNALGVEFIEQDRDVSTNMDLPVRPDGSVVDNIPIRFIKRLSQPYLISTDIIGSIMMYYDMAVNFDEKSKNLSGLELIKEALTPSKVGMENQYKKVENLMNFRYYGKDDRMLNDYKLHTNIGPIDLTNVSIKQGKNMRRLASMSMLALNFTTIEVGYLDAFLGAVADSVGGKFFTKSDLAYGYAMMWQHMPNMLLNLGNPNVNDWMVAAMQYNQLSKSNSEIFDKSDTSRWHKLFSQTLMGGYTVGDYCINTMILGATYHHYRLLTDISTGKKKFMSRSDAIRMYTKLGYTEKEAVNEYNNSKITLKDAYYVKDGIFTVKDDYRAPDGSIIDFNTIITESLEDRVATRMRDRTAMYNGVIPAVEKAKLQQNVWGSYVTLMRNFYVNTYWERIHTGEDFIPEEKLAGGRRSARILSDHAGYANFEQGENGNATYVAFLQGLYKYVSNVKRFFTHEDMNKLTRDQKQAVYRIMAEIAEAGALLFLMMWSIAFARKNDYDDDKDPTFTIDLLPGFLNDNEDERDPDFSFLGIFNYYSDNHDKKFLNWLRWKFALLVTRTFTERTTFYWPGTIKELVTSPSTAVSFLDDIGLQIDLWMEVFGINGRKRDEIINRSGYKGFNRFTKDIIKGTSFTGLHNVIRSWRTPGIQSTLNWYSGISPNNMFIQSKSAFEEEQKLENGGTISTGSIGKKKGSSKKRAF